MILMPTNESLPKRMLKWPETTYVANIAGAYVLPWLPDNSSWLGLIGEYARHVPLMGMFARAGLGLVALYNGKEAFDAGMYAINHVEPFAAIDMFARGMVTYHSARGALGLGVKR